MARSISSAFYTKMQGDGYQMALLIDLETRGQSYRWTSANNEITYTLSGTPTKYTPFPGQTLNGMQSNIDMSVSAIDFMMVNTGNVLGDLLNSTELDRASINVGRVFIDTPDLGRMEVFRGKLGDYGDNRNAITGQARNRWNSGVQKFPHYNYQDKCAWRFGGTGCGFDTSSITLTFSVSAIATNSTTTRLIMFSGTTLSQSYANARFNFGRLTVTGGPNSGYIRTIKAHSGDLLELSHPLPINSFSAFDFSIYPGCLKRRVEDCQSLYNNIDNFLGFPWIPIQEDLFG